jgi:hypothetical protein
MQSASLPRQYSLFIYYIVKPLFVCIRYSGIREWFQLLVLDFPRLILALFRLSVAGEPVTPSTAFAIVLKVH